MKLYRSEPWRVTTLTDKRKKKKKKKKKATKTQPGDGWSTDSDDERPLAAMGGGLPKVGAQDFAAH